jgi:transposase InsO family protein
MDEKLREEIALFRYGVIADLVHWPPGQKGLYTLLKQKASGDYQIPGSLRRSAKVETIRDWLAAYRSGGFEALSPKSRSDQGRSRAIPQALADVLCSLKEDKPQLTVAQVITQAKSTGAVPEDLPLAVSTVHRLLSSHHLMQSEEKGSPAKDRRRFAFEKANELWMSDVMHGPSFLDKDRRKRKSYLIGLLDDATRLVPYAAFAASESTEAFLPVLQQAILRRGIPKRLYVDNGAAYRSHHLALVCAKLGITLIHARPYQPQAKGKQERWFRTVRMQLLPLLKDDDTKSLEALNRRLWAYIEGEYHQSPHRGLSGDTPLDRWAMTAQDVHLFTPERDIAEMFLFEQKRRVQKDRTVSLRGVVFEVEASLVGQTVSLRFDPSQKIPRVDVYFKGRKIQQAKPVDAYANCFVRRDHATKALEPDNAPDAPAPGLRFSELKRRDEEH